jgi:hypothetical protein
MEVSDINYTALIKVKMSSNLICENYFLPFHADLFWLKTYMNVFYSAKYQTQHEKRHNPPDTPINTRET